jgi:hypothetical protein
MGWQQAGPHLAPGGLLGAGVAADRGVVGAGARGLALPAGGPAVAAVANPGPVALQVGMRQEAKAGRKGRGCRWRAGHISAVGCCSAAQRANANVHALQQGKAVEMQPCTSSQAHLAPGLLLLAGEAARRRNVSAAGRGAALLRRRLAAAATGGSTPTCLDQPVGAALPPVLLLRASGAICRQQGEGGGGQERAVAMSTQHQSTGN